MTDTWLKPEERPAVDVVTPHRRWLTANCLGAVALCLFLLAYAAYSLIHLQGNRWNFDEGIAVAQAHLMFEGYKLYDQVWTDHAPGQPVLIMLAFSLVGMSIEAARGVTVLLGLTGVLGAALVTRELLTERATPRAAWLGALVAAIVVGLTPNYWWASRAAMKGIPTAALASLAVALALVYARSRQSRWLALAALALGLSLWIKIQMAYLGLVLGLLVLWVRLRPGWKEGLLMAARDLTLLALGSLGPLALGFLYYDPQAMFEQVWGTFEDTRQVYGLDWRTNLQHMWVWLRFDNWMLLLAALGGAVVLIVRQPTLAGWVAMTWLGLTLFTPLLHSPLASKTHFEPAIFPAAALVGVAFGYTVDAFARWTVRRQGFPWQALVPLAAVLIYLSALPYLFMVNESLLLARDYDNDGRDLILTASEKRRLIDGSQRTRLSIAFLRDNTAPDDFVISEEPLFAFYAGRKMPPELAAMSARRISIKAITAQQMVEAAARHNVKAIALVRGSYRGFDPFMEWVNDNFELVERFDSERAEGYVRKE